MIGAVGGAVGDRFLGAGVPLRELVLVGATAAAVTYLLTSLVRVFAIRVGAVAVPRRPRRTRDPDASAGRGRHVHRPRLGDCAGGPVARAQPGFAYSPDMMAVITAGLVIVLVGVIDDRWGLDAPTKFVGQLTAAGVLVIMGVSWNVSTSRSATSGRCHSTRHRPGC